MSKMYIRVKKDGFIYDYNEIMAANPACEVVSEEVLYPERFVPEHLTGRIEPPQEPPKPKLGRPKRKPLDLSTADIPEAPTYTAPELAADASRGMP